MNEFYYRCDGVRLTTADLAETVPIHPCELDELVWPIDVIEDWLLHASDDTITDLGEFIRSARTRNMDPAAVIEALGNNSVTLHRLIEGARPNTSQR